MEELQRKLSELASRASSASGTHKVPISDLLTSNFLGRCSRFQSVEEMFEASGFKINSPEDFAAIPDAEWDVFIRSNTSFSSWESLLGEAGKEWTAGRLGL